MITKIRFAVDWCMKAASVDRITGLILLVMLAGAAVAWVLPALLIAASGQYSAFLFWPFMSLALTTFLVIPPYLFLAPRLFVWDGKIIIKNDEVVIDLTRFSNPADFANAAVNKRAKWEGTPCLLANGNGDSPFFGRVQSPTVSTQSYYRAMHKPDLLQYAIGKPSRWKDVELGLLAAMGVGALFVGLLAIAE